MSDKGNKCVCGESPVIINEKGAWIYRHDCKILKQRYEGTKFESEQAAIEAWNKVDIQSKMPKEGEPKINDPLQIALIHRADAMKLSIFAAQLEKDAKIQRADSASIMAAHKWARHDFWMGIYITKCYAEGKKPEQIFLPPALLAGINGKAGEQAKK